MLHNVVKETLITALCPLVFPCMGFHNDFLLAAARAQVLKIHELMLCLSQGLCRYFMLPSDRADSLAILVVTFGRFLNFVLNALTIIIRCWRI